MATASASIGLKARNSSSDPCHHERPHGSRKSVYTAASRARNHLTIIGDAGRVGGQRQPPGRTPSHLPVIGHAVMSNGSLSSEFRLPTFPASRKLRAVYSP